MTLPGKVAIVTGSGGVGSGRAEACRLAAEGCSVVVSDIREKGGAATVRAIEAAHGTARFFHCDVSDREQVRALIAFAEREFGGLDILVNNASAPFRPTASMDQWYQTIHTDLLGAMYGVEFATEAMRRRGGGVILNVSSTSALPHGGVFAATAPYDIAKAGILRLTTGLGHLRDEANIRVVCLVPDWVATPEVREYYDALTPEEKQNPRIPPALTTVEEIASAVVQLLTDDSLAGRLFVYWNRQGPTLIAQADPGYAALEPYPLQSR